MQWDRVGTHGMQSGNYRVAKVYVDGCTLYVLHFKDDRLGHFNDFAECKAAAIEHEGKA